MKKDVSILIRISSDLNDRLERAAKRIGISKSELIRQGAIEYLARRENKE